MKRSKQMSESIELGILLALSGGLMDAYSYIYRDHVFANAQTGNILLFGIQLAEKNWTAALHYLFPISAFVVGIALADIVRMKTDEKNFHWRQICVLIEAFVLICVAFFPQSMNTVANSLISFACGIQVESFRKIHGQGIATTMCIGNLRSATQNLCEYWSTKNRKDSGEGNALLWDYYLFCDGSCAWKCLYQISAWKSDSRQCGTSCSSISSDVCRQRERRKGSGFA